MEQKKKKSRIWIAVAVIAALALILLLMLTRCGGKDPEWQEHYDLGMRYLSEGNYEEAILAFSAAIEIDPNVADLYLRRGEAYVMGAEDLTNRGDYDSAEDYLQKAEDDFDKVQELDPDNPELEGPLDAIRELIGQLEKLTGKKLVEVLAYTENGTLASRFRFAYNRFGDLIYYIITHYDQLSYTDGEEIYYEQGEVSGSYAAEYEFDETGNLISMSNPGNAVPGYVYHYDSEGTLTGWTFTEVWGEDVYFSIEFFCEYDEQGRLTRVVSEDGCDSEAYFYDESGRIASAEITMSGYDCSYPGVYNCEYAYDAEGRLTRNTVHTPYDSQTIYHYQEFKGLVRVENIYDGESDSYIMLADAMDETAASFDLADGYTAETEDGYLMRVLQGDTLIYEFRYATLEEILEEQNDLSEEHIRGLYRDYFAENCGEDDLVYLADVTHDDILDMLVVHASDGGYPEITGTVYTLRNGLVTQIYRNSGSEFHVGGFYGWYLIPVEGTSYYNLCEETFGMWQGIGVVTFEEYTLDNRGNRTTVELLKLDSEEEGNHDQYGMVTEQAWDRYVTQLNAKLARCYDLYHSASEGTGSQPLVTDADKVLGE